MVAGQPFVELEKDAFAASRDRAKAQLAMAETCGAPGRDRPRGRRPQAAPHPAPARGQVAARREARRGRAAPRARRGCASSRPRSRSRQARAELEKVEDELRKTTIHAPISGRVIMLNAEVGEVVVSGTMHNAASVIAIIADLSEILVEVRRRRDRHRRRSQLGQPAEIEVDALPGTVYPARWSRSATPAEPAHAARRHLLQRQGAARPSPTAACSPACRRARRVQVAEARRRAGGADRGGRLPAARDDGGGRQPATRSRWRLWSRTTAPSRSDRSRSASPTSPTSRSSAASTDGEQVITGPHRVVEDLVHGAHVRIATGEAKEEEPERRGRRRTRSTTTRQ